MPLPRVTTLMTGLLLSPAGRRFAGRHAGKIALATLALQLWEQRQATAKGTTPGSAQATGQERKGHPRRRWSGRRA